MSGDLGTTLGAVTPGLDAGSRGRRLAKFTPTRAHVNSLIVQSGRTVLDRVRYLVRNSPYAANAVDYFASQLVGAGITPAWKTRKQDISRVWLAWTDEADAEGLTDFYGLQRRAARELFIAGEVFFRVRYRRPEDNLVVPMQLQMLPSEMLPVEDNRTLSTGNAVRAGIEFNAIGQRVAYWFYRYHPDDPVAGRASGEQVRVPADQVLHILDPVEAGQIRGLSMMAPAVVKLWLLDLYDDAELDRKRTAALFAWFRVSPDRDNFDSDDEEDGSGVLELSPGAGINLGPGEDVRIASPADVGGNYEAFQYRTLLAIAAACGLPYSAITGDVARANYGNVRAALMDFRRRAEATQHAVIIHQMCRRVGVLWLRQAVMSGAIPGLTPSVFMSETATLLPVPWMPPRWEWIDPLKDMKADTEEISSGLASRSSKIRQRGYDPEEVDAERAEDRRREQRLGLLAPAPAPPASASVREEDSLDSDDSEDTLNGGENQEPPSP